MIPVQGAAGKACRNADEEGKIRTEGFGRSCTAGAGETAFITEIAQRNNIPKKFLDTILLELRNAGMLRSKKGPGGGYCCCGRRPKSASVM